MKQELQGLYNKRPPVTIWMNDRSMHNHYLVDEGKTCMAVLKPKYMCMEARKVTLVDVELKEEFIVIIKEIMFQIYFKQFNCSNDMEYLFSLSMEFKFHPNSMFNIKLHFNSLRLFRCSLQPCAEHCLIEVAWIPPHCTQLRSIRLGSLEFEIPTHNQGYLKNGHVGNFF